MEQIRNNSNFLTVTEVAKLLNISRRAFQFIRTTGNGPSYVQISQRKVLFRRSDVDSWLKDRFKNTKNDFV